MHMIMRWITLYPEKRQSAPTRSMHVAVNIIKIESWLLWRITSAYLVCQLGSPIANEQEVHNIMYMDY